MNRLEHYFTCRDACCREQPHDDNVLSGLIAVEFDLFHESAKRLDADVRFSLDRGTTFINATPATGSPSLRGLLASPEGITHQFLWNTVADLGPDARYPDLVVMVLVHGSDGIVFSPVSLDNTLLN